MESSSTSMQPHTTAASFATSASESSNSLNTLLTFPPTSHPLHNPNPTSSMIFKRSLSGTRLDSSYLSDPMQEDNDDDDVTNDDADVTMAVSQCKRLKLEDGGIRKVSVQVSIPLVSNVSLLNHHLSLKRPHSFMSGEATAGTSSVWDDNYSIPSSSRDNNYPLSSLSSLPQAHPSSLEDEGDSTIPMRESGVEVERMNQFGVNHHYNHWDSNDTNFAHRTEHPMMQPESQLQPDLTTTTETATNSNMTILPMNQYLGTLHLEREERLSRKRQHQQRLLQQDLELQHRNNSDYIANDIPPYYTSSQNSMSSVSQGQVFVTSTNQDLDYANHYASSASLSSSSSSSGNGTDGGVIWTPLGHRNDETRDNRSTGKQRQYYQSQLPSDSNLY
jgi:hypothetical protein